MAAIRTQREIRQRAPWWLFGLLLLNFALMTYDARDDATKQRKVRSISQTITYPIQQGASSVGNWIGGFFGNFGELRRASTENQQLHRQMIRCKLSCAIHATARLKLHDWKRCSS